MSRLCLFLGTVGGVAIGLTLAITTIFFTTINPWIFALPGTIMFCGNIPYILKIVKHAEMEIIKNPTLAEKIADMIKNTI